LLKRVVYCVPSEKTAPILMYDEATFWIPLSVDTKLIDTNELTSTGVALTVIVNDWLVATEYVAFNTAVPDVTPFGTLMPRPLSVSLLEPLVIEYPLSDDPDTS